MLEDKDKNDRGSSSLILHPVSSCRRGFTIIELLVVIAIIIVVGSVAFIQTQSYRAKARDAERELEIKELQNALALYATNWRIFPIASGPINGSDGLSVALLNADVLPAIPKDPLHGGGYAYGYDSPDGKSYILTYSLETDSIPGKPKGPQIATP